MIDPSQNVAYYNGNKYSSIQKLENINAMRGAKRVIIFFIVTMVLPTILITIPLYLRHVVFADVTYTVAESDVVEINSGISSIFCSSHTLKMNSSFNAFQLNQSPRINTKRKHIRLKKSMTLPDDTLEYWGFYLLKGATVYLKMCSRYEGSRILVVRGERNLRTCGLMEHNLKKFGATYDHEHNQVKVTFESAQEIEDDNGGQDDQLKDFSNINAAIEDTSYNDIFESNNSKQVNSQNIYNANMLLSAKTPSKRKKHNLKYNLKSHIRNTKRELPLRIKRSSLNLYDSKIEHGGNALNYTNNSTENSVSSFESTLMTCYNGEILLAEGCRPNDLCTDVKYLEKGERMETIQNIISNGYYYYIFYSDNDLISNDIHAVFDIYKPTLKFANVSDAKSCINATNCTFFIDFWSDETVIVEVPMKDGIEHQDKDFNYLISTCHPRMSVYIIFPVSVMFLVLICAFM